MTIRSRRVFHGTFDTGFDPKSLNPEKSLHVGTENAALQRLQNLAPVVGTGKAAIHEFEITTRPSPTVWADPSLPSDESNRRYTAGEPRWWQAPESNAEGDVSRPVRYINEYEDPGSMSYVVMPSHIRHLSTQFVDLGE
jgi:hypothetical protein